MRLIYTTAIAVVIACLLVYLAVVLAWGYYFTGPSHYVAMVVGSPFVLASHFYPDLTGRAMALAFLVYLAFSFMLVIACRRLLRRFRRADGAERS